MKTSKEIPVEFTPSERQNMPSNRRSSTSQRGLAASLMMKIGIFVTLATVIAVGAYFGAQAILQSDDNSDDRRPVVVERGTLLDDVTASGSVTFPELESLRFDISGTVAELLVEDGEVVTEGQPLIRLDDVTIADLEAAVANAEITLQEAGEDLASILGGATNLETAVAESNLADARVASMDAAADLAEYTSSPNTESPATISAREELTAANEVLADAILAAEDDAESQDVLVTAAQETYDDAAIDYADQLSGWFGSVVSDDAQSTEPGNLFDTWGTSVDEIFEAGTATVKSPPDDPATPWNEAVVWVWTHLTPYPILTDCEHTSFTARCPSAEINDAWDVKVDANEALIEAMDDAAAAAKAQQVIVDAAQDEVEQAAENIVDSVNDVEINALAATLAEKIELEKDAEETLGALSDLDLLQVKLATAAINQANALLQNANSELDGANLTAPFDGVISSISVEVGDTVSRQTPTIDILDPNVVTIEGSIDEIDVLSLKLGDQVAVTLDALPDQILEGVVDEIGDGVNQQGVIEFPLSITLTPPDEVELIEGLSATATIILNRIDDALLVPLQAVGGSFDQPTVDVVTSNGFVTTNVQLGASDDFWVIVESGLDEGQEVLMEVAESVDPLQQLFGGGGAIRIPGGGGGVSFTSPAGGGGRGGR